MDVLHIDFFFLVAHNFVLAAAKVACVRKKTIIFTEQEMLPYDGQEKKKRLKKA